MKGTRGKLYGRLREIRTQACLSQSDLGRMVGITANYISKLENDPFIQVRRETLQKLADALETTVEDIWESPYEELDSTGENLARGQRAILRAYLRLNRKSRVQLVEILKQINENEEQEKANARQSTKKRKPDP